MQEKVLQNGNVKNAKDHVNSGVQQHQVDIGRRSLPGVYFTLLQMGNQQFQTNDDKINGCRNQYQPLFPQRIHKAKIRPHPQPFSIGDGEGSRSFQY